LGVYEAAYWGSEDNTLLRTFAISGFTEPQGTFYGSSFPGNNEKELLIGYGTSTGKLDTFAIGGGAINTHSFPMSEGSMLGAISLAEGIFSAGYGRRLGFTSPSGIVGTFAAALLNAGLFSAWVNLTYGRKQE